MERSEIIMSLMNELNLLKETKQNIYNAILNKGGELDPQTPFANYPQAIQNLSTGIQDPRVAYIPPEGMITIPNRDDDLDEIYLIYLLGDISGFGAVDTVGLTVTANENYTVDWGDGSTPEIISSGVQATKTYTAGYISSAPTVSFEGVSHSGFVDFDSIAQVLVKVSAPKGELTGLDVSNTDHMNSLFAVKSHIDVISNFTLSTSNDVSPPMFLISCEINEVINFGGNLFQSCTNLQNIKIDTSHITNMDNMFSMCMSLKTIPLIDTSNVTSFNNMFGTCVQLAFIPPIDTSSGVEFADMFYGCVSLQYVPLLNLSSATTVPGMFDSCISLMEIPLFDLSSATNTAGMFAGCRNLSKVPLFDTSQVTDFSGMFRGTSITEIPLLDVGKGIFFERMFEDCLELGEIPLLNTSSLEYADSMFKGCVMLTDIPLLNLSNMKSATFMFSGCVNLYTIPSLDLSSLEDAWGMFSGCTNLTSTPTLDLSSCTSIQTMFYGCYSIIEIHLLNTSLVTNFRSAFTGCLLLQTLDTLDFSSATDIDFMLLFAGNLQNFTMVQDSLTISGLTFDKTDFSDTTLDSIFTALPTVTGSQNIIHRLNPGSATCDETIATAKGWTVNA
jgi:hypothetical protein